MKYSPFLLLVCLLFSLPVWAQNPVAWGGLGYAAVGYANHNYSNLSTNLQNTSLITSPLGAGGLTVGGGGFALVKDKYILMGQGATTLIGRQKSESAIIRHNYGGGGFNVGYAFYNGGGQLAFATIGLGGSGSSLRIENQKETAGIFFGSDLISAGVEESFELDNAYLDLNLNFHQLFDQGNGEGFQGYTLGVQVGYQAGLTNNKWTDTVDNSQVNGLSTESINTFYIRILVGGGGFRD